MENDGGPGPRWQAPQGIADRDVTLERRVRCRQVANRRLKRNDALYPPAPAPAFTGLDADQPSPQICRVTELVEFPKPNLECRMDELLRLTVGTA